MKQNAPAFVFCITLALFSIAIIVVSSPPSDHETLMSDAPDWVSAVGNLTTGMAAAFAAWQGVRSLTAWRVEATGRRRIELAEDVLSGFYQIRAIIHDARAPFVRSGEMQPEEGVAEEVATNSVYAPRRRLRRHLSFITEFRAKRYRFAAIFDPESTGPFDTNKSGAWSHL